MIYFTHYFKGGISLKQVGTMPIETNRLMLRKFQSGDAVSMFENYCCDERVTKYLTWKPHSSISATKSVLELWIEEYKKDGYYQWAIALKEAPEVVIGSIAVVSQELTTRSAEIGYCLAEAYWGYGIMSEALAAAIKYLFLEGEFLRVFARHDTENEASGRVMQKCGMSFEGVLRKSGRNNRGIVDMAVYSILGSEYNCCNN